MGLLRGATGGGEGGEGSPPPPGTRGVGHVVSRLIDELPAAAATPAGLADKARVLDNFYVPSRYPNGHPEGAPFEHYGPLQSDEAIRHASEITALVRARMA